jgi:GNAT superfamily N-acetyltransferase
MADLDQDLLTRMAANCGGAYREWARRMGRPWALEDDLSLGDLQLPVGLPPNNATCLRPPDGSSERSLADRLSAFFDVSPGGGFEVWTMWPTPELSLSGFASSRVPGMIRDAGGEVPSLPEGLRVHEVEDPSGLADAEDVIDEVFGAQAGRGGSLRDGILDDDFRIWVGYAEDRPVATSTAYISDGFVGIYAVATREGARGRGVGEALTWAATLCRPDLPATLQASSMGRTVYGRMGYRAVADFEVWERERTPLPA